MTFVGARGIARKDAASSVTVLVFVVAPTAYVNRVRTWILRAKNDIGCVSTQRHKRVSYMGFANRDFTSLSLKKIEAQGRFKLCPCCLVDSASLNLKSTPLPTTP